MEEDSGTCNSSVLNAGDEDSCSTKSPAATFTFSIIKEGLLDDNCESDEVSITRSSNNQMFTRQLFPVPAVGPEAHGNGFSHHVLGTRMLALSSSSSSNSIIGELPKIAPQPPQQQVKKSRRGPRSRSSQYRGVTFYRRTGRWESHIWLVTKSTNNFPHLCSYMMLHPCVGIVGNKCI